MRMDMDVRETGLHQFRSACPHATPCRFRAFADLGWPQEIFIPWTDVEWIRILELVLKRRFAQGLPSTRISLALLAREVRKIKAEESGSVLGQVVRDMANRAAESAQTVTAAVTDLADITSDTVKGITADTFKPSVTRKRRKSLAANDNGSTHGRPDMVFTHVSKRFFDRPYFKMPRNLNHPFDEKLQPPDESWVEHTLQRMSDKVAKMEHRNIEASLHMQDLLSSLAGVVHEVEARCVKVSKPRSSSSCRASATRLADIGCISSASGPESHMDTPMSTPRSQEELDPPMDTPLATPRSVDGNGNSMRI